MMLFNIFHAAIMAHLANLMSTVASKPNNDAFNKPNGMTCFIVQTQNGVAQSTMDGGPCVQGICPGTAYLDDVGLGWSHDEEAFMFFHIRSFAYEFFHLRFFANRYPHIDDFVQYANAPSGCTSHLGASCPLFDLCSNITLFPTGDCPKFIFTPFTLDNVGTNLRAYVFSAAGVPGGKVEVPPKGLTIKEGGYVGLTLDFALDSIEAPYPLLTAMFLAQYTYSIEGEDEPFATVSWRSVTPGVLDDNNNRALLQEIKFGNIVETGFTDISAVPDGLSTVFSGSLNDGDDEYSLVRNVITCGDRVHGIPGFA